MRRLFAAAALASLLLAQPASAYHDTNPYTDYSTATRAQYEFALGIHNLGFGILDTLQVDTYYLPWLLKVANLRLKWRFYETDRFSLAAQAGLFTLDGGRVGLDGSRINIVPAKLVFTMPYQESHRFHLGLGYTNIGATSGDLSSAEVDGRAGVAASQGYLLPSYEWLVTRKFAVVVEAHVQLFSVASASGDATTEVDERTTVELYSSGEADLDTGFQAQARVSGAWSWERMNMRLGGSYGHFVIPMADYQIPKSAAPPIPFVYVDLFWVFD